MQLGYENDIIFQSKVVREGSKLFLSYGVIEAEIRDSVDELRGENADRVKIDVIVTSGEKVLERKNATVRLDMNGVLSVLIEPVEITRMSIKLSGLITLSVLNPGDC